MFKVILLSELSINQATGSALKMLLVLLHRLIQHPHPKRVKLSAGGFADLDQRRD